MSHPVVRTTEKKSSPVRRFFSLHPTFVRPRDTAAASPAACSQESRRSPHPPPRLLILKHTRAVMLLGSWATRATQSSPWVLLLAQAAQTEPFSSPAAAAGAGAQRPPGRAFSGAMNDPTALDLFEFLAPRLKVDHTGPHPSPRNRERVALGRRYEGPLHHAPPRPRRPPPRDTRRDYQRRRRRRKRRPAAEGVLVPARVRIRMIPFLPPSRRTTTLSAARPAWSGGCASHQPVTHRGVRWLSPQGGREVPG